MIKMLNLINISIIGHHATLKIWVGGGIKWNIHSISLFLNFCALLKVETGCVTKKLSKENEQRWFQVLLLVSLFSRNRNGKKISRVLYSIKKTIKSQPRWNCYRNWKKYSRVAWIFCVCEFQEEFLSLILILSR